LNGSLSPLLFWLLGSVLICALATNALWLVRFFASQPRAALLVRTTGGRWLWQVGRFLFYWGIPYLVLGGWPLRPFQGLLSLQDMGFVRLDGSWTVTRWLPAVGTGLGLGSVTLVILILARRHANNVPHFPHHPWWAIVIDVAYLEVHWAFYRAALAVLLGDLVRSGVGVFAGLGLVYAEWAVNPFWRQGWREESQAAGQWLRAAVALVIAVLFLFTQNLWICLAVHWLLELVFYSHNRQNAHTPPAVVG
jgi:hypothetical protein